MSYTDNTTKETRDETSPQTRGTAAMVRRMAVKLTDGAFWRCLGHLLLDGLTREAVDAEVFTSMGFYARPKAGANAEAIVVFPGGAANPVIVGTRDEDLRKAYNALLVQDSALMCNRATIILCKPDGTVEIRASGGAAAALATKADIDALKGYIASHTHSGVTTGAGASGPPVAPPPSATGTTVLKAQ